MIVAWISYLKLQANEVEVVVVVVVVRGVSQA
jgi:hypothetical protein